MTDVEETPSGEERVIVVELATGYETLYVDDDATIVALRAAAGRRCKLGHEVLVLVSWVPAKGAHAVQCVCALCNVNMLDRLQFTSRYQPEVDDGRLEVHVSNPGPNPVLVIADDTKGGIRRVYPLEVADLRAQ